MRVCEICQSAARTIIPHLTISPWPVVSCGGCGFVYLGAVPSYDVLSEQFAWEKTRTVEKQRRSKQRWAWVNTATRWRLRLGRSDQARLCRALNTTGNVLDIGCAGGCRIPDGPTPYGIEISKALADKAAPLFEARGGAVIHAPAIDGLDAFADGFFAAILMRSYLEHEARARMVLEKAFAKLSVGGVVYVRVPNFGSINRRVMGINWCGFRFPDHVNYFTGTTLQNLAGQVGFTYRRINWLSLFDDNLIVELRKPRAVGGVPC